MDNSLPNLTNLALYPFPTSLSACENEIELCWQGSDLFTERGIKLLLYIKQEELYRERGYTSFDSYIKELSIARKRRTIYSMLKRYQLLEQLDIKWDSELSGKAGYIDNVLRHSNVNRHHEFVEEEIPGTINKEQTRELVEMIIQDIPFPEVERELMQITGKTNEGRFQIRAKEIVPNKFKIALSYISPEGIVYFQDELPEWVVQKLSQKLHIQTEWFNLESKL